MPARPSVSALKADLRQRMAMGLFSRISLAHCTASSSNRSSGTTVLTRPMARASCAEYRRHRYQISHAFLIHVAALAAHALVTTGAEGLLALACEEHHAHLRVLVSTVKGVDKLKQ